jgi:hypothetical protein
VRRRPGVGTLAWLEQTRGLLSARDRVAFLGQACVYGLLTLPQEVRQLLGIRRRRLATIEVAELRPPDTSAAREAEELIAQGAPPVVVNHAYRTYAWGAVLAAHDGLRYDAEVVYVAALLHDLFFASPHAAPERHCFTLPAAERAKALAAETGWESGRGEAAAEAVALHLNVRPARATPEAYVVYAGARLDVTGYRFDVLHPDAVAAVLAQHPRLELKREFAPMFKAHAEFNRGSRADFYTRYLAVNRFVKRSPFEE